MSNDAVLVVALLGGLVGTILYVTLLVLLGDGVSDEDDNATTNK